MAGQFTPNVVAGGTIRAFRAVAMGASSNRALEANANDRDVIGVADGSIEDPLTTTPVHATTGTEVRLQPGLIVKIEGGGTFSAGGEVASDANGKAVAAGTATTATLGIAQEDGADGKIARIIWRPSMDDVGT